MSGELADGVIDHAEQVWSVVRCGVPWPQTPSKRAAGSVVGAERGGERRTPTPPSARMLSREVFGGMTKETERPAEAPNARRRMRSHAHLMGQITPKM